MRRREILEAAKAVFAEKGYTHATLDEIAQRAEFGKGTLYNYFEGGKDDILFAIIDEIYDDLDLFIRESFSPQQAVGRLREAFESFVQAWVQFFVERRDMFMILIKEAYRLVFSDDPGKAAYFQRQGTRIIESLIPTLEAVMDSGEMRRLSPHAVAHMIVGNIKGIQMHMVLQNECAPPKGLEVHSSQEAAQFLTTMLLDGLVVHPEVSTTID